MTTVLLVLVGVVVLVLTVVGLRAIDNSTRLLKVVTKRLGWTAQKVPPHPWRVPAFFAQAVLCPMVGVMILVGPEHRRFMIANIALGPARMAVRRGIWCEHHFGQIQNSLQAWVNRYEYGQFDA